MKSNHRTKANAEKAGQRKLNQKRSRVSGFYTRKTSSGYTNYYYSK